MYQNKIEPELQPEFANIMNKENHFSAKKSLKDDRRLQVKQALKSLKKRKELIEQNFLVSSNTNALDSSAQKGLALAALKQEGTSHLIGNIIEKKGEHMGCSEKLRQLADLPDTYLDLLNTQMKGLDFDMISKDKADFLKFYAKNLGNYKRQRSCRICATQFYKNVETHKYCSGRNNVYMGAWSYNTILEHWSSHVNKKVGQNLVEKGILAVLDWEAKDIKHFRNLLSWEFH